MAGIQHTVTVVALDRDRLHAYTGPVCDLAESTRARGRDIVLPDGRTIPGLSLRFNLAIRARPSAVPAGRFRPIRPRRGRVDRA
ncbi:hypothetical protein ACFRQM_27330 [Streptomyces sp. NPDC056831]|uniref:hypothetical protein n=1 Tax=Streptomyces sp. NPDC056831 TaxID=3345954 RepID=UPI003682B727